MRSQKSRPKKPAEVLLQTAEVCFEAAAAQHASADKLEESANKLDTVGDALTAKAIEIKGEAEIDAGRNSPPLPGLPDGKLPPLPTRR